MGANPCMQLKMGNDLDSLSGAARTIETFLDTLNAGAKERYAIALAFEEMGTNIVKYGFDSNGGKQEIDVKLSLKGAFLELQLEDSGKEFNPLKLREPDLKEPIEDREIGGLGVHLVRKMADSLDYKRENGRNVLTITFKLKS